MNFSIALTYMPIWLTCVIACWLGLCVGSFLNVIIYRIPIGPEKRKHGFSFNINSPRSHCPVCNHTLAWYENIPIFSWLYQRAACRHCSVRIPKKYPAVELLVGLIGLLAWYIFKSPISFGIAIFLSMLLLPLIWWIVSRTRWNRFMMVWCLSMGFVTLLLGVLYHV